MRQWYKTFAYSWWVPGIVAAYAILWGITAVPMVCNGMPFERAYAESEGGFVLFIAAAAIVYGGARAIIPNPCRKGYFAWLYSTPWTARQPLPLGPLHLVWQDLVLIALLTVLMHLHVPGWGPIVPLASLTSYGIPLSIGFAAAGESRFGYAFGFALAPLLLLAPRPLLFAAGWAIAQAILFWGIKRSLSRFPWGLSPDDVEARGVAIDAFNERMLSKELAPSWLTAAIETGWPLGVLAPETALSGMAYGKALVLSGLGGWWFLWLAWWVRLVVLGEGRMPPPESYEPIASITTVIALSGLAFCAVLRIIIYMAGHASPISIFGRVFTRRPIIWGYDKIFLAPAAAVLIFFPLMRTLIRIGVPPVPSVSIALTTGMAILLCGGPTLQDWHLTGTYQSNPRFGKSAKTASLQKI